MANKIGIYDKAGVLKAEAKELKFEGEFMGIPKVTVTLKTPIPIALVAGDYLDYRGERFTLGSKPNAKKVARRYYYGEAFQYEDVIFQGVPDELTRCKFLDVVPEEEIDANGNLVYDEYGNTKITSLHYTSLPKFSFYAESVKQLQERLQANLDRLYSGSRRWRVKIAEGTVSRPYNFSFDNKTCWEALCEVNNVWELSFIIRGRVITIGAAGSAIGHIFRYGKGKGLKEVNEENNEDALIVTRLRAYGSNRNIPYRYYNKLWRNNTTGEIKYFKEDPQYNTEYRDENVLANWTRLLSESMYMPNLMLPTFTRGTAQDSQGNVLHIGDTDTSEVRDIYLGGNVGTDAWLQSSEMVVDYGVNEDTVYFDQEDETGKDDDDIYPSMEGMTAARLEAAGIHCDLDAGDNGNLDEVVTAEQMTDNGLLPDPELEEPLVGSFTITIKDIGFDMNDYLSPETAQISMKSGECVGRTFDITDCTKQGNKYVLTCNRFSDQDLQLAFPYKDYNVKAGDKFVLLHIYMPEVYVFAAEQRLYERAKRYLLENDHNKGVYSPTIDNIFLKRNPAIAASIREGDILTIEDEDLGLDKSVTIKSLTITVGESLIEEYEVTLSEDNEDDLVTRVAESVSKEIFTSSLSKSAIESMLDLLGEKRFISKTKDDTALGKIDFKSGITTPNAGSDEFVGGWLGSGWRVSLEDSLSKLEVDSLTVRKVMNVAELLIHKVRATGGEIIVSNADGKIRSVSQSNGNWVVELENPENENMFVVGDYVRCQTVQDGFVRQYWREVLAINGMALTLDDSEGAEPLVGDTIVQLGSTDESRQGAIRITATEGSMPVIDVLDMISPPTITTRNIKARLGGLDGIADRNMVKQPQGYGLYSNNAYLRGEFVLSNGTNIGSQFEVLEDRLLSRITDSSLADNIIDNPYFTEITSSGEIADWTTSFAASNNFTQMRSGSYPLAIGGTILNLSSSTAASHIRYRDDIRVLHLAEGDSISQAITNNELNNYLRIRVYSRGGELSVTWYGGSGQDFTLNGGWETLSTQIPPVEDFNLVIEASDEWVEIESVLLAPTVTSEILQTADEIRLSVENTGVDITNGKIVLSAERTIVDGDLEVNRLKTIPTEGDARIEAAGSLLQVFGSNGLVNIRFGVDELGYAILQYLDKDGTTVLYDLGPNGLTYSQVTEEKRIQHIVSVTPTGSANVTLYEYQAKRNAGVIVGGTIITDPNDAKTYNGKWFTASFPNTIVYANENDTNKTFYSDEITQITTVPVGLTNAEIIEQYGLPATQSDHNAWVFTRDESGVLNTPIKYRQVIIVGEITGKVYKGDPNGVAQFDTYYWQ